VIQAEYGLWD